MHKWPVQVICPSLNRFEGIGKERVGQQTEKHVPIKWSFYFVFSFWLFWEWGLYPYSFCEYLQFCHLMKVLVWCEKNAVPMLGATAFMCYEQNVDDSINSLYHFMYCMTVKEYIHIYTIGTLHVLHKHESTMVNWLEVHTSHLTPKNATRISAISLPLWIWALRTQGAHFHPVQKGELAKTAPRKQRNEWEVGCNPHISHVYCE